MRILFAVACLSSSVVAFKHIPLTVQRSTPLVSSRKSKTFLAFGPDFLGLAVDAPQLPSTLLSFADQGNNLAGIFFQASLLPYLSFLYFLGFRGNRTPALGQFGFAFLLLFVAATIPSGIVAKTAFGDTLANVDWLHGSAEILLTVTNLLIVSGFRTASVSTSTPLDKVESFQRLVRFCSRLDSFALTSHAHAHSPQIRKVGSFRCLRPVCGVLRNRYNHRVREPLRLPVWSRKPTFLHF